MKLYATVISERARKGQGGNKKLEVVFTCEKSKGYYPRIGEVILSDEGDYFTLFFRQEGYSDIVLTKCAKEKGEQQKGEDWRHCKLCGKEFDIEKGHRCGAI